MLDKFLTGLLNGMDMKHAAEPYVGPVFRDIELGPIAVEFSRDPVYDGVINRARRGYDDHFVRQHVEGRYSIEDIYRSLLTDAYRRGWEVIHADEKELSRKSKRKNEITFAYEDTENGREVIYLPKNADVPVKTVGLRHEMIGKDLRLRTRRPHEEMEHEILTATERTFTEGPFASETLAEIAKRFRTNYEDTIR